MSDGLTQAEEMTRRLVHAFWRGDGRWIRSVTDDGFSGIGILDEQYMTDMNTMVESVGELPRALIFREQYRQVAAVDETYVVAGRYSVRTDLRERLALADTLRVTAVWRWTGDGLKLLHLHASGVPRAAAGKDHSPMKMASEAYRYLEMLVSQRDRRGSVQIRDVTGETHLLGLTDIVYLEAKGQNTIVNCRGEGFRVHETLGRVRERYGLDVEHGFLRIHRSYLVNVLYIVSVGDEVHLSTGVSIPVPRRRVAAMKRYFAGLREGDAD